MASNPGERGSSAVTGAMRSIAVAVRGRGGQPHRITHPGLPRPPTAIDVHGVRRPLARG